VERILVVGTTGSGKSTMASRLAARLGIPHVELDALHWGPGWSERPAESFRAALVQATAGPRWVVDGNYSRYRELTLPRADAVIWLDYSLPVVLWRLWFRTWRRWLRREMLWGTNVERMRTHFFSRDSLFLWALKTHGRRRREYVAGFASPEWAHLELVRLRNPKEAERWLAALPPPTTG
jgi:adenylate kinase family enzyme